ncbi:MAG: hypothetical protein ACRD2A_05265 [Vicinamibacterales bacterium]
MMVENTNHLDGMYALALQFGDYRRAAWFAVRGLRRLGSDKELWRCRLRGCLARRSAA